MKSLLLILATTVTTLAACNDNRHVDDPSTAAMNTAPTATAPASDPVSTATPVSTAATPVSTATAPVSTATTRMTEAAPNDTGPTSAKPNAGAPAGAASTPAPPATNPKADNSGNNATPAGARGLTAGDQGGSEGDRKITQQIRQAVMGDKALSFMAKNVKIITINGKVTLKGPVKSDQERAAIETAAKRVAGDAQVDNQIEIKK